MVPRSILAAVMVASLALAAMLGSILRPAVPALAAASLSLSRQTLAPGDTLTVQGYGFTAQDSVVVSATVRVNGVSTKVQSSAVTNNGYFRADLQIPRLTNQDTYTIQARDFHGAVASGSFAVIPLVTVKPGASAPTAYVIPQHSFYVSGSGYAPNETVRINVTFPLYNGNAVIVSRTVQAGTSGQFFEASLTAPADAKASTITLSATGNASSRTGRGRLHVFYRSYLLDSGTVRPGAPISVRGREFVPNSVVRLDVTISRSGSTSISLTRNVTSDSHGNFDSSITLPADVSLGTYTVNAFDTVSTARASAKVLVSVHPTIAVSPTSVLPGEAFTASGDNFGSGARVTVVATFPVVGGGTHAVSGATTSGSHGQYSVRLAAPGNAAPGQATVRAHTGNGAATTHISVMARPTPTTVPTNAPTPTPVPTATATPLPPPPKKHRFAFRYVSVWYHTVRVGTYDHLVVQSTLRTIQGVWVHVYFPNGSRTDFYTNTDRFGFWESQVNVARNVLPSNVGTAQAVVTFRLWHGSASRRSFVDFNLVH